MPAVGVVASLALSSVGVTAASVGTAILGGATAVAAIEGGTIIASALGGAVIGAGTGALSAAVQGGDIGKGALMGAVSGGVGGGTTTALSEALSPGISTIDLTGANYAPPEIAGSQALGAGFAKGVGSFAGTTAGALAGGQPLESALKSGLISGVSGGVGAGLGRALDLGSMGSSVLGGALSYGLGKAFQPSGQSSASSRVAQPSQPSQQYLAPSQTTTLGTSFAQPASGQALGTPSALGSALFAAPGFSYSAGGPVLGGSDTETKAPRNVWSETDKSLRDVGSTVT
jgi:hypothetical protein